jgi:hypothetical protein
MNPTKRFLFLAALLLPFIAACATYGGRPVRVKLSSTPAGATCYVLPATKWIQLGEQKLLANRAALAEHAVTGKVTPCEVELPMIRMVYVAERDGLAAWTLFTPSGGGNADVTIVAAAPAPAPETATDSVPPR